MNDVFLERGVTWAEATSDYDLHFLLERRRAGSQLIWRRRVAVRVDISVTGSDAELIDIRHIPLTPWPWSRLPLFQRNYRGRGLGTLLLRRVFSELKARGVRRISGQIVGDAERLKRWYRREGFQVDDETLEIWREL